MFENRRFQTETLNIGKQEFNFNRKSKTIKIISYGINKQILQAAV